MLFIIVVIGNMLGNTLETHWRNFLKHHGNPFGELKITPSEQHGNHFETLKKLHVHIIGNPLGNLRKHQVNNMGIILKL
jgi:hypothetical protein